MSVVISFVRYLFRWLFPLSGLYLFLTSVLYVFLSLVVYFVRSLFRSFFLYLCLPFVL